MASENEASCESDPNFAVICGFLEKFGVTCGLANIDFVDLQEMLENTQEVSHELIELHVKLMRRARRSVSSNDRWERALIKTCHTFSSQDAWEIERFGYKKARITSKLRILKELLEMQFDYNQKFKNEINKMSATELRTQPLGRDRMGRAYWFQCDESCQIRVYKDDPDDETWSLVARDRDGLVSLITQLGNGDTTKSSSEPVSNEDSNSVEVEKPTLDTGQTKPASPKPKIDSDNAIDEKMEIDTECTAAITTISESSKDVVENKLQNANLPNGEVEGKDKEEVPESEKLETKPVESKYDDTNEDLEKEKIIESDLNDNHDKAEDAKVEEVEVKSPEESCEDVLNLCSKDISNNDDMIDDKTCLDLSVKATPCLRIKPITELMPQPHVDIQKKEFMGIKGKYIRNDTMEKGLLYPNPTHLGKAVQSASYDAICYKRAMEDDIYSIPSNLKQPRFDRPTLLGKKKYMTYINEEVDDEDLEDEELDDEIEEPLMLVQGEGSGFPNESINGNEEDSPIIGEVVEDPVLYVSGEGNGEDCETGNKSLDESKEKESKEKSDDCETSETQSLPLENPPSEQISCKSLEQSSETSSEDKNNTSETILDNTNNEDSDSANKAVDSPDALSSENVSSPLRQTFFFGNSFSPNTSPMKTASLSFGASTVVDSQNTRSRNASPAPIPPDESRDVGASEHCFEKTDQNLVGNNPSHSKVPENVDIENVIDNNKEISEKLLVIESEDKVPKESELGQKCDETPTNTNDFDASEVCEDKSDCGDVSLVTSETENPTESNPSSKNSLAPSEIFKESKTRDNNVEVLSAAESVTTFQNPESSNSECPEEATTSDCGISNLRNDLRDNDSDHEVTTRIEEKVSSTVIEEEPTTSDESNSIASIHSGEKVDTTIKSVLPDSCLEDREVTGASELERIDSSSDEMDADEMTSADDVPTSTTDIEQVNKQNIADCASEDINNISISISEKVNEDSEAQDTINHNRNSKELKSMETRCEAESTRNIFNDAPSREDVNEPVAKISDNVIDSNQTEENNDLLSKENQVDIGDNTKDIDSSSISTDLVFNKNDKHKQVITDITNVQIDSNTNTSSTTNESMHITDENNENYSSSSQQLHPTEKDNENRANITEVVASDSNTEKLEEEESLHSSDTKKEELSIANCLKIKNVKSEREADVGDKSRSDESINHDHITEQTLTGKSDIVNENVQVETTAEEIKDADGDTKDSESKNKAAKYDIIEKSESAHKNVEKESSNKEPRFDATEETQTELESKDSPVVIIETDEDTNDTRSGIDAIKAIKITNVQAKCEILEKVEGTTSSKFNTKQEKSDVENKHENLKEKAPNPQPLRFLRGRRPNQMLSVKSYATRNKNLVLRKEIKPQALINDKNDQNSEKNIVNNTDPLLNVVKIEDHIENNMVRRSTRRKPGDHPQVHPIDVISPESNKKGKGRPRKSIQNTQELKQIEEVDVRHSKRLRLSNNQIPSGTDVETIDLTAESDGRRISARNCNENIPLRGGMTIKPIYKEGGKPSKSNGPFLTCVNIQKLKENPLEPADSPLSVESSGGGDNSDVVIIEDDPLAVPDPYDTVHVKGMTLNSFQLDIEQCPQSTVMTRSLRKRGITEPEISMPTGGKRRKTKGKRQVDLELRRSIEEQKKQEISSSDEEKTKEQSPKRKPQPYKKKQETEIDSDAPAEKPVKKPRAARKKTLLGLDVPAAIEELNNVTVGHVRQSRRIAQLKIKEEAERRKLEDITMTDPKDSKKKNKKNIDKDYKAEKRKRPKPPTEDEVTIDVPEVEEKKKKRKRKRKHKDPRKIFDESNPWRSSSGSSTSNDEVEEEEEEIAEYSEVESPLFKSDHEFSPESDIEDTGEPQPLKRARTARKEDDIEDDVDDHACQKCGKSDHPEWILLCDGCDNGWHCSCLRPALFIIPEGDWFCPPCQHNTLVKQLEEKLAEFDKKMAKREIEVRRKERLAYVGISLANVLPVKDTEEKRKKKEKSEEEDLEDEESESEQSSSSETSSSSDSDEPIYQLRQRRQAHSYRFNDYDELINSAIQDEMEAVKGAGNQGRGKDISTIVNAEKEQVESGQPELEPPPPVVPVETKELPPAVVPPEHHDSDEDKVKPVKKFLGRKKHRKLNSLDVSSGDDPDSDEDFKGSSSDEEDDDDFEEDLGSDTSEVYSSRRRKGPIRRSTRARTSRYDKDFINDDTEEDEEEIPRKKKSRSVWNESDTEESDISWKWSSRRKSSRNTTTSKKKRSKKSKKHFDDSDEDRSKKKKRRIKYGGLNDDEEEEETAGRRTRGKKINYADVLASDSDDEIRARKAPPRIESDDDYVANEDEDQDNDEEYEKEESVEKEGEADVEEKPPKNKEREKQVSPPSTDKAESVSTEVKSTPETQPTTVLPPEKPAGAEINPEPTPEENFDLDNLNSSIEDLPDDIVDDNDVDDELNPIDEINKNLEEMDEEEMEKLMEEEEYANKQLQLVAMQLEKEKKRKEREAKKKEITTTVDTKAPKKRGKKKLSNVVQIATLQVGPDMQSNPELSEPPGVTIPIFSEIPPSTPIDGSPKKRRGRGKGKKTLEKEAAAAAAAAAAGVTTSVTPTSLSTSISSDVLDDQSNIPTTVDTVASDDIALANAAAMHGAELAIAAPPQPFSQTQPTPSVITRMLQAQPGAGNYSPMGMGHNYYADQPPPHAENSPTPPVSNSQMATCVPVSNSMAGSQNTVGQLPPMSQSQPPYMHGAPSPRGMPPSVYRQPPPIVSPYQRTSPAPSIPPMRVRTPAPSIPPVYHSHHPLDPSPSGGGPINVATSSINTPDRSSPISIPPSSDSPLSNKSDPTPPPPPYSRPQMRFSNVNSSPLTGSPIRQNQQLPTNLIPPQHMQQQPSPVRNNMPPYHPAGMPPSYYGNYMQGSMGPDDALPPSGYNYSDQFSETNSPQDIGKSYDEENSGEFGGLVSYFSSQREDDLDT
ncbi:PHD finger motif containing protein [Oryctes borbonicus]|uniref:PHD finger motif containing protein n=1 Tax=Oryctes borbonicus TaxID=1629725 RepID=A0A0T6B053_9SCAR|nr:PHD finger motif containing protein [Oryctes borbonicus]